VIANKRGSKNPIIKPLVLYIFSFAYVKLLAEISIKFYINIESIILSQFIRKNSFSLFLIFYKT